MKEPKPMTVKIKDILNLHPEQSVRRAYRFGAKPPVYINTFVKKQTNVERFYEWLQKCGNIHLADDEKVSNAFNKIPL